MTISRKQRMQLMQLATAYSELLNALENKNITINKSTQIREGIYLLYREICSQQSSELKEIE